MGVLFVYRDRAGETYTWRAGAIRPRYVYNPDRNGSWYTQAYVRTMNALYGKENFCPNAETRRGHFLRMFGRRTDRPHARFNGHKRAKR